MLKPNRELKERLQLLQIGMDCASTINRAADKLSTDDRVTVAGAAVIVTNVLSHEIKRLLREGLSRGDANDQ